MPHFVKVTFAPLTEAEMDVLLKQEERLDALFSDPAIVEYDGYGRGDDDFCMYFYGSNADSMATLIIQELKDLPIAVQGKVVKRYGDAKDAREVTMDVR